MKKIADYFVEKYDWFIYGLAVKTMERMCRRNSGFAYFFELQLRKYRQEHPISKDLENATEVFFVAINNQPNEREG